MCAEFECGFHWKIDKFSTRKTTVRKYVQGIFSLAKNNAFGRSSYLNAEKVFEVSQIFDRENSTKVVFDYSQCCKII